MPANPSQADQGAQDYWLNCSPCHGDQGQGLTDEFRRQYPTEDQNCWLSGCHGRRTYPNGWTIPTLVPALIGPGALGKFGNGVALEAFISAKMPFQKPGSLTSDTYWRLTAFLLRQNGYWSGTGILDESSAERVRIPFAQSETTPPAPTLQPTPAAPVVDTSGSLSVRIIAAGILLLMGLGFFLVVRRRKPS
jgi:cytochrome c